MINQKVFLSSTARDLQAYRDAVDGAIRGLDGYACLRMEYDFGARDANALDLCKQKVTESNILVLILGRLYGSCPPGGELSFTELEYVTARDANLPRLVFVAPDDFPVPDTLREPDQLHARQQAFRQRVSEERVREQFRSPDDLAIRVVKALRNWEQSRSSEGRVRAGLFAL